MKKHEKILEKQERIHPSIHPEIKLNATHASCLVPILKAVAHVHPDLPLIGGSEKILDEQVKLLELNAANRRAP